LVNTVTGNGVSGTATDVIMTFPTSAEIGAKPNFSENTAFNKDFGTSAGQVLQGNTTTISPTQSSNIVTNNGKVSFPEAPNDGQEYVRKSEAWWVASAGGGSAGGDLGGTYPNPKVVAITETSGPTSLVIGAIADGELLQRVGSTLVGYKPVIVCCPFGAKSDTIGRFLVANGKSSDADETSKTKTRQPIIEEGTLTRLAYQTKNGTTSTQMKVHVNGVVQATVVLSSMNANKSGVETISVSVLAGDYVEIEWDASDKPGECTMYFKQELS
jgi:hypothetical protein